MGNSFFVIEGNIEAYLALYGVYVCAAVAGISELAVGVILLNVVNSGGGAVFGDVGNAVLRAVAVLLLFINRLIGVNTGNGILGERTTVIGLSIIANDNIIGSRCLILDIDVVEILIG